MYEYPTNDVTVNDRFTKKGNVIITLYKQNETQEK